MMTTIELPLETVRDVVLTCVVLHNILRSQYQGQGVMGQGQWPGKMAQYNCYYSNQSFSGLITSSFQDYQIFQKQLISCACSKYHNHLHNHYHNISPPPNRQTNPIPNISHATNKQTNPVPNISHPPNKQTNPMPNISHPTNKQTNPMPNIIPKNKRQTQCQT